MSALYVFALTNAPAPTLRHGNRQIEFIEVAGIHAAVERVTASPSISEDALRAQHDIVMKIAAKVESILPARFGALVDRQELESLVTMRLASITEALECVSGRVQMTVRVCAPTGRTMPARATHLEQRSDGVAAASGTEYLEQRRREANPVLSGQAEAISTALHALVHGERSQHGQRGVDWTLYHLVDRDGLPRYERAMERFKSPAVIVTGPWPPFAFVPDLWS